MGNEFSCRRGADRLDREGDRDGVGRSEKSRTMAANAGIVLL